MPKYAELSRMKIKTRKVESSSRLRTPTRYHPSRRTPSRRTPLRHISSRYSRSTARRHSSPHSRGHSRKRTHSHLSDYKVIPRKRRDYGGSHYSDDEKTFDVMELPYSVVPFVIGVHNHRIKEIRAKSGCSIQIDSDITSNGTTICNFYGRKSSIEAAREMVDDIIQLYPNAAASNKSERKESSSAWKVIEIPKNECGFIVGENGETLKNLQLKHGVTMKVVCQHITHGKKLLHITGPSDGVDAAYDEVEAIINGIKCTTLEVAREAVGPIMGRCGRNLMWFSSKSGCKITLQPLEHKNAAEQVAILRGTDEQIAAAIMMMSNLLRYCSKNVEEYCGYFHVAFEELENICIG